MIRLHVIVEGQTEEGFVNRVLAPELAEIGIFVNAHGVTTGRRHGRVYRGGLVRYEQLAADVTRWMKQDQAEESWFTTMIDLYALPSDFPGQATAPGHFSPRERVEWLEAALANDITRRLDPLRVSRRFIPYIQLHEFEALLFSDPPSFLEAFPGRDDLVGQLIAIRRQYHSPEEIDDGPATAPSKRILAIAPDYQKPVAGLLIAERIGLGAIRNQCAHFAGWFDVIRALA